MFSYNGVSGVVVVTLRDSIDGVETQKHTADWTTVN